MSSNPRRGSTIWTVIVVVLIVVIVIYCWQGSGPIPSITQPDVRYQLRDAVFDNSKVLIITNAGSKPLFNVWVSAKGWDKRYLVAEQLNPGATVEAGWKELARGFHSGDIARVYAEGYSDANTCTIP